MMKKLSNRLFSFLMAVSMMVSQVNSLTLTTLAEEIEQSPTAVEEVAEETGSTVVDDEASADEESADLVDESETTEAEVIKEDEEQKEEKEDEEKVDVSSLNGMDFSSKRLLVATDSMDDEAVVGSYNNVYLLQYDTEYDAKVDILKADFDASNKTLTFSTDKFSTYAIVYKDVVKSETTSLNNKETTSKQNTKKNIKKTKKSHKGVNTGVESMLGLWASLLATSTSGLGYLIVSKKRKKK